MKKRKIYARARRILLVFLLILAVGLLVPQVFRMPVQHADTHSYSQNSYWAYPWGKSVTHKGVDIFAKKGTSNHSATYGIVIYKGKIKRGGNVVIVLGPKWRLHYYAHLDSIRTKNFSLVSTNSEIGTVGTTPVCTQAWASYAEEPHVDYNLTWSPFLLPHVIIP
jgi:murein DD-endopeptidase MepM/ murein hydrolase activator NlpD